MQHADETLLSVVVLELGSSWPPWLSEYQQHAPNSVVIAQSSDECGAEFARRICRKMDEIGARDIAIHAGLVVSNGELDEASVSARDSICSALLRVMLQKKHGELVLASDLSAGDDVRHALFALAGTLCDELRGSQVTVRVRFDTVRPASATRNVRKSGTPNPPAEVVENSVDRANGSR